MHLRPLSESYTTYRIMKFLIIIFEYLCIEDVMIDHQNVWGKLFTCHPVAHSARGIFMIQVALKFLRKLNTKLSHLENCCPDNYLSTAGYYDDCLVDDDYSDEDLPLLCLFHDGGDGTVDILCCLHGHCSVY